ncbi:unnamed protein product [Acanthosepion pharaonis]|uniref:Uncharacterized protein n=1 Tax=Acanthosepion pharaonis TaxID=158019 RepID=A0A812DLP8_ACAPH|nr:unnamed protein product [Sepia pharaonis]
MIELANKLMPNLHANHCQLQQTITVFVCAEIQPHVHTTCNVTSPTHTHTGSPTPSLFLLFILGFFAPTSPQYFLQSPASRPTFVSSLSTELPTTQHPFSKTFTFFFLSPILSLSPSSSPLTLIYCFSLHFSPPPPPTPPHLPFFFFCVRRVNNTRTSV